MTFPVQNRRQITQLIDTLDQLQQEFSALEELFLRITKLAEQWIKVEQQKQAISESEWLNCLRLDLSDPK